MINELKVGDYIENLEIASRREYDDVIDVFKQWGFDWGDGACDAFSNFKSDNPIKHLINCHDGLHQVCSSAMHLYAKRKLTYDQIMSLKKHQTKDTKVSIVNRDIERSRGGEINIKGMQMNGNEGEEVMVSAARGKVDIKNMQINGGVNIARESESIASASGIKPAAKQSVSVDYLKRCIEVQAERGKQYGSSGTGERSFDAAAKAFNALTGEKLSGSDVCLLMTCLKVVRQNSNKSRLHDDSLLDGISYLSLWADELTKELS